MLESLLFVSFINLLAMLPLFAAFRLAEHIQELPVKTLWETIVSEPWLLCLAVVSGSTFLAMKLWKQSSEDDFNTWPVLGNAAFMLVVWVIPGLFKAPDWLQVALIQSWTIGASILLLIASFPLPFRAIQRMLGERKSGPPGGGTKG